MSLFSKMELSGCLGSFLMFEEGGTGARVQEDVRNIVKLSREAEVLILLKVPLFSDHQRSTVLTCLLPSYRLFNSLLQPLTIDS